MLSPARTSVSVVCRSRWISRRLPGKWFLFAVVNMCNIFTENVDIMRAECAVRIALLCLGTANVEFPSPHSTNCTTEIQTLSTQQQQSNGNDLKIICNAAAAIILLVTFLHQ